MAVVLAAGVRSPIFVGGTGRSGTTIIGDLIGQHPDYFAPPFEIRFHTEGARRLVRSEMTWQEFEEQLRSEWFHTRHRAEEHGLALLVSEAELDNTLVAFQNTYPSRPLEATRRLVRSLMDPLAEVAGAKSWVDTTPNNTNWAPWVASLFGNTHFVHIVRNGLDVACSVVGMPWGPDTLDEALVWWEARLRRADERLRGVIGARVLTIHLEDLVLRTRDESFAELLDFLNLWETRGLRRFFDQEVQPTNVGRWRTEIPARRRAALRKRYEEMRDGLAETIGAAAPAPDAHLLTVE